MEAEVQSHCPDSGHSVSLFVPLYLPYLAKVKMSVPSFYHNRLQITFVMYWLVILSDSHDPPPTPMKGQSFSFRKEVFVPKL